MGQIRLLCSTGLIVSTGFEGKRYIICVGGSHFCIKPENQGKFDEFCFVVEEMVENE